MANSEVGPKRFQLIDHLLDAVFELEDDQVPAFLDQACAGDESLRAEIERLIASDKREHVLINSPAFQAAADLVQEDRYCEAPEEMGAQTLFSMLRSNPKQSRLTARSLIAGRYEILSRLGKGGMSEVWHAYDVKLRMDVALKSLRKSLSEDQDPFEFIRREVRLAREVISPNVCRIFDLVSEENYELISMEHIDGITLMELIEEKGPLPLRDARDIAAQFLAGLDAVHTAGLVHRDFKPENIMITRTGRVVVMDLGIAQHQEQTGITISGTLPYMSSEQIAGEPIDARSDVFSAGVVLAEMIHTKGMHNEITRERVWQAIRKDPMQLPESDWKEIIMRAVSSKKEDRFESAIALSHALEEIAVRAERIEDRTPYPGLASYSSRDSEYFFGREQEIETIIRRLQQLHMMAMIGPSGAGKTSFLQAGLIPALPKDWRYVFVHPGGAPMVNLQQALVPLVSGDEEATARIIQFEEPDIAIWILSRLRCVCAEFVLIVDRFEELFTLSSHEVQSQFAAFLSRVTLEANVRILLVMRDDFFIFCKEFPSLVPIYSEVTPMLPLTGSGLRRALVQPALKCGYKFEDESLVHDILSDVEKEKGVLPLLAFAASLLWEKRDRTTGQLTRKAYLEIGEVRGALAQHAENTMQRIGIEEQSLVREIFRNLITAQNTRVARDTEELLSVFEKHPTGRPAKQSAKEVLRAFIDARLLTSFENRIEITHESLISNWPRLVKWHAQDAESAQMRDDLRQAAQLWNQKGRPKELLWTGSAFVEFQAWRERYAGGLTTTEESFAQAMERRAHKRRRQRRMAIVTIFVVLLGILALITTFWRNETIARNEAVSQTKLAEAGKILAIGRAIPDADPSTKLAYAIASLEFADLPQARRFALQALSEGPPALIKKDQAVSAEFSPDGQWIAVGLRDGRVQLISRDGKGQLTVNEPYLPNNYIPWNPQFSSDGKFLVWTSRKDLTTVKVWSFSERKVVRNFHLEGLTRCLVRDGKAFLITAHGRLKLPFSWNQTIVRIWRFGPAEPEIIGRMDLAGNYWKSFDIDSQGKSIAYIKDKVVCIRSLEASGIGAEKSVGAHSSQIDSIFFRPNADEIAASDTNDEIRLWSLSHRKTNPVRVFPGGGNLWFDSTGSFLVASGKLWDLMAPIGAEPRMIKNAEGMVGITFDRQNRCMAIASGSLAFYSLKHNYPYIFPGKSSKIRFTPDGKTIVSGFRDEGHIDGIQVWNMPGKEQALPRILWSSKLRNASSMDVDSTGKYVIANDGKEVHLISLIDGSDSLLKGILQKPYGTVAFSPDGKFATAAGDSYAIEIWDLKSGRSRILEQSKGIYFPALKYSPDGTLFSGDLKGDLERWNLNEGSYETVEKGKGRVTSIAISRNGRYLATIRLDDKPSPTAQVTLHDLKEGKVFPIYSHGNRVNCVVFDPAATRIITGDDDGIVRVGPITGESPHLLLGHDGGIGDVAVDPSGQWIASIGGSGARLWRMPAGKPFDSLAYADFLNRLRQLTNVRAVPDKNSPTGYRTAYATFTGWEKFVDW